MDARPIPPQAAQYVYEFSYAEVSVIVMAEDYESAKKQVYDKVKIDTEYSPILLQCVAAQVYPFVCQSKS